MRETSIQKQQSRQVWSLVQQERGLVALAAMAIVGIGIATYLTIVHYAGAPLACSTTGLINCAQVTSSAYSVIPGTQIPITIPGMAWFLVNGILAAVGLASAWQQRAEPRRLRAIQAGWAGLGLLVVLYLVYVEIVLIGRICEWCTAVHLLTLATFLVTLGRLQGGQSEALTP